MTDKVATEIYGQKIDFALFNSIINSYFHSLSSAKK